MNKNRWIRIFLLLFFVCSSLSSLDAFVLCSADGDAARLEPFHLAHAPCMRESAHQYSHAEDPTAEISHRHIRCTDVGLSGHPGLVKERVKLPEILCLWISVSPGPPGDLSNTDGLAAAGGEAPVSSLSNHPPGIDLGSVVLLI